MAQRAGEAGASAIREDVWPRFVEAESRIIRQLADAIQKGSANPPGALHPEDLARVLVGAAERIARMKFAGTPAPDIERFFDSILRIILDGLAGPGPHGE